MKLSSVLQVAGGIVIAAGGLYIFFKDVDISEVGNQIRLTEWWVIALVAVLSPLSLWLRAIRWKYMLPSRESVSKKGLFPICVISFAVNNIMPARIGEAVRAVLLWHRNKFTIAESIGALVLERVIDSTIYLSFIFIPIFLLTQLKGLYIYGIISLSVFTLVIVSFVFYSIKPSFTRMITEKIIRYAPVKFQGKLKKLEVELLSNIDWLFDWRKVIIIAIFSYLIVLCYAGMIWLLGVKLEGFALIESIFGVAFAALGAAIPLSPGYVGTLHAVLQKGLSLLGVPGQSAAAITVLYHAIGYIIVTLMGVYFFFAMKINFSDIGKAKEQINA